MSQLTTFVCEYKILPDHATRENCMTYFGGMTEDDDKRALAAVKLLEEVILTPLTLPDAVMLPEL